MNSIKDWRNDESILADLHRLKAKRIRQAEGYYNIDTERRRQEDIDEQIAVEDHRQRLRRRKELRAGRQVFLITVWVWVLVLMIGVRWMGWI